MHIERTARTAIGRRGPTAQAALEFALILPLAVGMLAMAVDITAAWNAKSRIDAAAAECARVYAADPSISVTELERVAADASGLGEDASVELRESPAPSKDIIMRSGGATQRARYQRKKVEVVVSSTYVTFFPTTSAALGAGSDGAVRMSGACSTVVSALEAA